MCMRLHFSRFCGYHFVLESSSFLLKIHILFFHESRGQDCPLLIISFDREFVCACVVNFSDFSETISSHFTAQTDFSPFFEGDRVRDSSFKYHHLFYRFFLHNPSEFQISWKLPYPILRTCKKNGLIFCRNSSPL